jgi:hypothetical protein
MSRGVNITTEDILSYKNRSEEDLVSYIRDVDKQRDFERSYVAMFSFFPQSIKVQEEKEKPQFYDFKLLSLLTQISTSISIYRDKFCLSYIEDVRDLKPSLILRTGQIDEIYHECVVGFILHNLKLINFPTIYGLIDSRPPYYTNKDKEKEKEKEISYVVNHKLGKVYSIYESIKGLTFTSFSRTCTAKDFMMYFSQVVLSLNTAFEVANFTHYNLTSDNVILEEKGDSFYLPYQFNNETVYLLSLGSICKIVNLSSAYIEVVKEGGDIIKLGKMGKSFRQYGVYRDSENILSDVYKLLCMSIYEMMRYENTEREKLFPLLRFFNKTESIEDIMSKQRPGELYFSFPYTDETSIHDFISYSMDFCHSMGWQDLFTLKEKKIYETPITDIIKFFDSNGEGLLDREEAERRERHFISSLSIPSDYKYFLLPEQEELLFNPEVLKAAQESFEHYNMYFTLYDRVCIHMRAEKFMNLTYIEGIYLSMKSKIKIMRKNVQRDISILILFKDNMKKRKEQDVVNWYLNVYASLSYFITFK